MKKKYLNSICLLVLVVFGNLIQAQKSKKQAPIYLPISLETQTTKKRSVSPSAMMVTTLEH